MNVREGLVAGNVTGGGGKATKQKPNGTSGSFLVDDEEQKRNLSSLEFLVLTGDKTAPRRASSE